jgi:hypothetical protein
VTHRSQALNNNDDFNQRKKKTEISWVRQCGS